MPFRKVLLRPDDEVTTVLLVHELDLLPHLPLESRHARAQLVHLVLEREDALDPGEVEPELGRQALDRAQPVEVALRVQPGAARRPAGPEEPLRLVDAQRLRVHADELRGDADRVARPTVHQLNAFSRGSSPETCWSFSIASFSAFESFFGTVTWTRAIRSPLPEPLRRGAPRLRMRRSLPSSVPAGTFSCTGPSGVGTSTVAPRAASANVTGTSISRSASPRR